MTKTALSLREIDVDDEEQRPRAVSRVPPFVAKGRIVEIELVDGKWTPMKVDAVSGLSSEGTYTITYTVSGSQKSVTCPTRRVRQYIPKRVH